MLKVMAGDKVDIGVRHYYLSQSGTGTIVNPVADLLLSLASGIVGTTGEVKGTLSQLSNSTTSPLLGAVNSFRTGNNPNTASKPKAYLNWILLDEQFNYVAASSGAQVVGNAGALTTLAQTGMPVTKSGYMYVM